MQGVIVAFLFPLRAISTSTLRMSDLTLNGHALVVHPRRVKVTNGSWGRPLTWEFRPRPGQAPRDNPVIYIRKVVDNMTDPQSDRLLFPEATAWMNAASRVMSEDPCAALQESGVPSPPKGFFYETHAPCKGRFTLAMLAGRSHQEIAVLVDWKRTSEKLSST